MNNQNLFLCILSHGVNSSKYDLELLESKIIKLFNSAFSNESKLDNEEKNKENNNKDKRSIKSYKEKKNSNHKNSIDNTIYCINSNCNSYIKSHSNIEILAKNLFNETEQNLENEILPSFEKQILAKYKNNINNIGGSNDKFNTKLNNSKEKLNENKKSKYTEEERILLYEHCQCDLYISVLGHSLGGLIMRYFIKLLYDKYSSINNNENKNNTDNNNNNDMNDINEEILNSLSYIDYIKQKHPYIKNVIPCSYISVSTPHLGSCIPNMQTNIQLKSKLTNSFQSLMFSTLLGDSGREMNIPKNSLLGNILWRNNNSNNQNNGNQETNNKLQEKNNSKINSKGNRTGSRLSLHLLLKKDNKSNNSSNENISEDQNVEINKVQDFNDFQGIDVLNNTEYINKLEKFPCRTLIGCLRNDCFVRYVSALATVIDPRQKLQEEKKLIPDYKEDVKLISYSGFEEEGNEEMNSFYQKRLFEPKYPLNIVDITVEKVDNPDITNALKKMITELNESRSKSRRYRNDLFDYNNLDSRAVYIDKENNNQYTLKLVKAINTIPFRRLTIDFQTSNYILQLMTHGLIIGKKIPCDSRTKELMNKMVNYLVTIVMVDYLWISKQTHITLNNY